MTCVGIFTLILVWKTRDLIHYNGHYRLWYVLLHNWHWLRWCSSSIALFCFLKEIMLKFFIGFFYIHWNIFDNVMLKHINMFDLRNVELCWDVILTLLFLLSMQLGDLLTHGKITMINFITALLPLKVNIRPICSQFCFFNSYHYQYQKTVFFSIFYRFLLFWKIINIKWNGIVCWLFWLTFIM